MLETLTVKDSAFAVHCVTLLIEMPLVGLRFASPQAWLRMS
jgi:hypothetical protein